MTPASEAAGEPHRRGRNPMSISYASIVDHPLDEVFAWHTRPGAMRRLVPPWQPMWVVKETESLANGRAILGLPGGLRWIAQHDPTGYDPPRQFRDVLSSDGLMTLPPRVIGWWRHTHRYSDAGGGTTRVLDEVDTTVPGAMLRSTFAYRHRQLADDLAAHRDAAGAGRLVVAMTGSSGLVGTALAAMLVEMRAEEAGAAPEDTLAELGRRVQELLPRER